MKYKRIVDATCLYAARQPKSFTYLETFRLNHTQNSTFSSFFVIPLGFLSDLTPTDRPTCVHMQATGYVYALP